MLRTNLSTRPFYNERAVHVGLAVVGLIVLAVTVLNLVELVRLSRQNTVLAARIREDRSAADELTKKARQTHQGINQEELKVVATAAREANALIDGRTFSWTLLFNYLESTLPPDVMLTSVRPAITDAFTRLTLTVLARRTADVQEFIEKLEATGAFERIVPRSENQNEEGLTQTTIEAVYVPESAEPSEPAADAAKKTAAKPADPANPADQRGGR
jgi:Tfp pilus assembly protein PilN